MVKDILTAAGFVEDETFRETRFLRPPEKVTYAVYDDSFTCSGSDDRPGVRRHSVTIELYEYAPDPASEKRLERVLSEFFPRFTDGMEKQPRYWIEEEQLYQVVYTFDFIEKI